MKKQIVKIAVVGLMLVGGTTGAKAQILENLGNAVGSVLGSSDNKSGNLLSSLTSIISSDKNVTAKTIAGTWTYTEPAIAFTSSDMLTQMGGKYAAKKIETKLAAQLKKVGVKPGTMTMTFDKDGNFTSTLNGKKSTGTYTIKGEKITLQYAAGLATITGYAQLSGKTLSLTFDSSKLLAYVKTAGALAGKYNSTINTISSLTKNVKGMKSGLAFTKK